MPTPIPTPTAAQIVTVAEIMMVSTSKAESLIAADSGQDISDAKWAATLTDITRWATIGSDAGDVKRVDQIEFFEGSAANARLDLRNALRIRYGLPILTSEASAGIGVEMKSLCWF
jgi:hypothetical protein